MTNHRWQSALVLFFASVFVLTQGVFAPGSRSPAGFDSSVYVYVAQEVLDGGGLYKDVVDHKGPFLYLLNMLGLLLGGGKFIGIWLLEVVSLFGASVLMYKTARLYANQMSALFGVVSGLLFLCPMLTGGDVTEEWALPLISVAVFIFCSFLKKNAPLTAGRLLALSVAFVLVLLIKPSMVAVWGGLGIAALWKWIYERRFREMFRCLGLLCVFCALTVLPFVLYFYFTNTLKEAWYCVFQFNFVEYKFTSTGAVAYLLRKNWYFVALPLLASVGFFLSWKDKYAGVLLGLIATAAACSLGGGFGYYLVILAPLLAIALAHFYEAIPKSVATRTVLLFAFCVCNALPLLAQFKTVWQNYTDTEFRPTQLRFVNNEKRAELNALRAAIVKHSAPEDKILVRGYATYVYLYADRKCAGRFPYPLIGSSWVIEHYAKEAEQNMPKLVIQGEGVQSALDVVRLDSLLARKYRRVETPELKNIEIWERK